MRPLLLLTLAALAGCATPSARLQPSAPVPVRLIAFNDFHGALEPPRQSIPAAGPDGREVQVPAGGAAYLASAVRALRQGHANTLTVAAGDLISASPLISANFLDEPTVLALNAIGLDFAAVGNHEFDRGRAELLRMQNGGCERHTNRTPCAVDPNFPGARYRYLAANVRTEDGRTLFPGHGIRRFGSGRRQVAVGVIGLTLRETGTLVTPSGVAGLSFDEEAASINALVPRLRAEGADAIVVVIHQGLATTGRYDDPTCPGVSGDLLPILARLDPAVDVVVSGHTHNAYLCEIRRPDGQPMLVTSAQRNGQVLTAIDLMIDPAAGRVVSRRASQTIVQGEGYTGRNGTVALSEAHPRFPPDPAVAALVRRYADASATTMRRVVGRFSGPAPEQQGPTGESVLGRLLADAYLAATRAPNDGGAQIAFINETSVRADIVPAANGEVTFGQLFTAQPFGNTLVVRSYTGRQLGAVLEQQFDSGSNTGERPIYLIPSQGFTFTYDVGRPAGQRIVEMRLDGQPIAEDRVYRVAMNNFMASGGDNFTIFRDGRDEFVGPLDLDAIERYLAANNPLAPPAADRLVRLGPPRR